VFVPVTVAAIWKLRSFSSMIRMFRSWSSLLPMIAGLGRSSISTLGSLQSVRPTGSGASSAVSRSVATPASSRETVGWGGTSPSPAARSRAPDQTVWLIGAGLGIGAGMSVAWIACGSSRRTSPARRREPSAVAVPDPPAPAVAVAVPSSGREPRSAMMPCAPRLSGLTSVRSDMSSARSSPTTAIAPSSTKAPGAVSSPENVLLSHLPRIPPLIPVATSIAPRIATYDVPMPSSVSCQPPFEERARSV
jgi:hypothetical protein